MIPKTIMFNYTEIQFLQILAESSLSRLLLSGLILILGLILVEILIRSFMNQTVPPAGAPTRLFWRSNHLLIPARVVFFAILLRFAEIPLHLVLLQEKYLRFLEGVLILIPCTWMLLYVARGFNALFAALPPAVQDGTTLKLVRLSKNLFRFFILIGAVSVFVSYQKDTFVMSFFESSSWRFLMLFLLMLFLWAISQTAGRILLRFSEVASDTQIGPRLRLLMNSLLWPVRLLLVALVVYTIRLTVTLSGNMDRIFEQAIGIITIIAVLAFVYKILDIVEFELNRYVDRGDNLLDKSFTQMVRLVLRFLVLIVAAIFLIQTLSGKPVTTLIAGLGIGALAIALAAQDTLKNLFASIMIMVDKPFAIGQRILIDGFDGIVESVGFRSTRIRTLASHQVTIPNEKMAGNSIENVGERRHIKRVSNIGVTYDTSPAKVEKALQIIREILADHQGMHPDFPPRVFFDEFNDYALNIKMTYWFHPADFWSYSAFSEEINLRIMRAFEAEGIEFAFPTSTTYLAQDDRRRLKIDVDLKRAAESPDDNASNNETAR
ncbi:mechanosensitive ion channel family protein [bacterium]|nr:mechanosensitive ion channel family protein [bacterium]